MKTHHIPLIVGLARGMLVVALLGSLVSCTTSQIVPIDRGINSASGNTKRRTDAVAAHPEWVIEVKEAVLAGTALPGMNREQLIAACGAPLRKNVTTTTAGRTDQWAYDGPIYIYFNQQGIVSFIQQKPIEPIDRGVNSASGDTKRRTDAVAAHPEWDKEVKEAVLAGTALPGMSREQLIAACGAPLRKNVTTTTAGRTDQWAYDGPTYIYFNKQGMVSSIQRSN